MVIPLILGVAARVGAGAAVRGAATRVVGQGAANSVRGRIASQAVGSFGVNAIQRGHQNQQQPRQTGWNTGATQWARENPGEAAVSGTLAMARSTSMLDRSTADTQSLLQSTQFGQ